MYAVIQKDLIIFGTGTTKEEAVADCKEWIDKDSLAQDWEVEDFPTSYNSVDEHKLVLVEATQELVEKVQKEGGDIIFYVNNNVAGLEEN